MKRTLQQIADAVGARLQGNGKIEVHAVASLATASAKDLVFVEDQKHLQSALASRAAAVIAGEFASTVGADKPLLISDQPKLAFARAASLLSDNQHLSHESPAVHPTAIVDLSAHLEKDVIIGERAVIGAGVAIGEATTIGPGCVIGRGVKLGKNCRLYPQVTLYSGTSLGDRVIVHAGAVLGSDGFGYVRDRKQRALREISADWVVGD